ncbi:MAG: hypothetical protein ABI606_19155 [Rhodoferax sp.]
MRTDDAEYIDERIIRALAVLINVSNRQSVLVIIVLVFSSTNRHLLYFKNNSFFIALFFILTPLICFDLINSMTELYLDVPISTKGLRPRQCSSDKCPLFRDECSDVKIWKCPVVRGANALLGGQRELTLTNRMDLTVENSPCLVACLKPVST